MDDTPVEIRKKAVKEFYLYKKFQDEQQLEHIQDPVIRAKTKVGAGLAGGRGCSQGVWGTFRQHIVINSFSLTVTGYQSFLALH